MNFLAVGDLHLGCWPKNVPATFSYWDAVFNQIEEYAKMNGVERAVQLGDVHDSVQVPEDERFYALSRFQKSKLEWDVYHGNHDYTDVNYNTLMYYKKLQTDFNILQHVHFHIEPTVKKYQGQKVAFLPWPYNAVKMKEPGLCFAHFALSGAKSDNGYILKESDKTIDKKHYWIIGDLHQYQTSDRYLYPGAILQFKYNDSPKKYFAHFTGTPAKPKWKRIQLRLPYQLEQQTVQDPKNIPEMLQHIKARNDNVYTQLKCSAEIMADYRYDDITKIERVLVEYSGKKKVETETDSSVMLIDSETVRRDLVRQRLKKKGFSKLQIDKAMSIIQELEKSK